MSDDIRRQWLEYIASYDQEGKAATIARDEAFGSLVRFPFGDAPVEWEFDPKGFTTGRPLRLFPDEDAQ